MRDVLGDQLNMNHFPSQIAYGSDCSGVDAPMWALKMLMRDFQAGY